MARSLEDGDQMPAEKTRGAGHNDSLFRFHNTRKSD